MRVHRSASCLLSFF